jgi:hypothetical protein
MKKSKWPSIGPRIWPRRDINDQARDGTFAAAVHYAVGDHPISVAAADVTGDGKADIIVGNRDSNTVSLLVNLGNGAFAAQVSYPVGQDPQSPAAADVTGDGHPDIIVPNYGSNTVAVMITTCSP